jgi:hypothetical protein
VNEEISPHKEREREVSFCVSEKNFEERKKEKNIMADITQFKALTGADDATAKYYLNKTNPRNLQVAVNFFFDAGGTSLTYQERRLSIAFFYSFHTLTHSIHHNYLSDTHPDSHSHTLLYKKKSNSISPDRTTQERSTIRPWKCWQRSMNV